MTKTNYKDFTAVDNAIGAVETGYDITKQNEVEAFANAINTAIDGLVYREANYDKVTAAIAKIPSDLSCYTDTSVKALEDVKNVVVRGKNITEQAVVDGYATAIQKAIDGLVKKAVVTDKDNHSKGNNENSPRTGDSNNMFLWLAIFIISAGGIAIIGITKKNS